MHANMRQLLSCSSRQTIPQVQLQQRQLSSAVGVVKGVDQVGNVHTEP
jgi:hypothetical protein